MDILKNFLHNNNLTDPDDMDALLDCTSLARELISHKQYSHINRLINYTVENSFSEAFMWTVGILQEEFEKENCTLSAFCCDMGGHIADYDSFVHNLQVDFNAIRNSIEKVYIKGEVEAFFNVMVYRTVFENVFFVSKENFDTRDNDYIQYKLAFAADADSLVF